MTIKELIQQTNMDDVIGMIRLHYGVKEIEEYIELYKKLLVIEPNENIKNFEIYILAYYCDDEDEEDVLVDEYSETDTNLCFDVSGRDGSDVVWSIAASSYADFLGYYVGNKTLETMSYSSILAHCLYEITAHSFDDNV